ncbi:MoaD/ThiS family protein [Acinetobacter gerneri]|uniref:MoaD/ThiS family protein n=1 Tax=Acinetobacter gerneri TaxID=202952 RepID=UPI0028A8911B|nr:MoaD/ThiS family protein [Acinetobacter gerneri]
MIYIKYFGHFPSKLGLSEEYLDWENGGNTETLLEILRSRNELWEKTLAEYEVFRVVVQKRICHQVTEIVDGDEIGILPPVTGG